MVGSEAVDGEGEIPGGGGRRSEPYRGSLLIPSVTMVSEWMTQTPKGGLCGPPSQKHLGV